MKFLHNTWYVGAWSTEITHNLFTRTICEEPVLLFRQANGEAIALSNRCPHRFAPLHLGKHLDNDCVRCPYHGLEFDSTGACVKNPHGDNRIPAAARVRKFPLIERFGLLWIWFGMPDDVDESLIPDFSFLVDPQFATVKGVLHVRGNYELYTDNLMDLSHVEFLHGGGLGSDAIKRGKHEVRQDGMTVHSNRWCPDGLAPPVWDAHFDNYGKPVDHWLNMRWDAPAHMALDVGVTPAGRPRQEGIFVWGTDIITPETADTSYYFWGVSRSYRQADPSFDTGWTAAIDQAFGLEDATMVKAVHDMMGSRSLDEMKPILLAVDAGAMRARRVLRGLIERESQRTAQAMTVASA